jgi:hypothetical protein
MEGLQLRKGNSMSVYKKLQHARRQLLAADIKKSGKNKFAGFEYFELADFLPSISCIFDDVGLCGVVRFHADRATLTIVDSEEPHTEVEFTTPLVYAENSKGQAIQNLGSTHTYMRRYLWLMAMEIVVHDAIEGEPQEEKPKAKPKAEPKLETVKGKDAPWQITIAEKEPGGFSGALKECTDILLTVCESAENVNAIFQTNRALYDKLKEENKVIYDEILEAFKTRKTSFQ